ncbi:MAG TPA: hypothetical protein VJU82_01195 [Acidobacteriaceae bacterium]|nr:hypothetical protein [Acidobacteriaceae bacterium]
MREPNKVARLLLAVVVGSSIFADYWEYSRQYHANPQIWMDIIRGTADAPQQYRIGVPKLADFIARQAHFGLRHALTLIDLLSAAIAAILLYVLFERSDTYRRSSNAVRWMGAAAFLFLLHLYLSWITWYQRPETLASACTLAATLALASSRFPAAGTNGRGSRALGMLALAAIQSLIRADVAFAAHIGMVLACIAGHGQGLALGRKLQAATSVISLLLAGGIQFYLMHVVYPQATYGRSPVIEIKENLTNPVGIVAFLLFMIPCIWLASRVAATRRPPDGANFGLLLGSAVYFLMWFAVGRIEEVRIFLPFAVALIPLTVEYAMRHFVEGAADETCTAQT